MPESGVAMLHPIHCLPGPQVSIAQLDGFENRFQMEILM